MGTDVFPNLNYCGTINCNMESAGGDEEAKWARFLGFVPPVVRRCCVIIQVDLFPNSGFRIDRRYRAVDGFPHLIPHNGCVWEAVGPPIDGMMDNISPKDQLVVYELMRCLSEWNMFLSSGIKD